MLVLAIDTPSRLGAVALVEERGPDAAPRLLAERRLDASVRHGAGLIPAVDAALNEAGVPKTAIGAVVGGVGPGSYTSLRIGLATARTLAFALRLPLAGAPSFDAYAYGLAATAAGKVARGATRLLIAEDAFRKELYLAEYRLEAGRFVRQGEIRASPPEEVRGILAAGDVLVAGDGPTRYPDAFPSGTFTPLGPMTPDAAALAELAIPRLRSGAALDPRDTLPLYLRTPLPLSGRAAEAAS